jgi:hypothetical protein
MSDIYLHGKRVARYDTEVEYCRGMDDYEAWFSGAVFEDGTHLTDEELAELTENYSEVLEDAAFQRCVGIADFLY